MKARQLKVFVWPVALLVVGLLLIQGAYLLAGSQGLTFRLYGVLQGMGEIVVLIGVLWFAAAAAGFVLGAWRRRNG